MDLPRNGRDYYAPTIATNPEIEGTRQASFDNGETWKDGTQIDTKWVWLVAGPGFDPTKFDPELDPDDTKATITEATIPLLRILADPVVYIGHGPGIHLWS